MRFHNVAVYLISVIFAWGPSYFSPAFCNYWYFLDRHFLVLHFQLTH